MARAKTGRVALRLLPPGDYTGTLVDVTMAGRPVYEVKYEDDTVRVFGLSKPRKLRIDVQHNAAHDGGSFNYIKEQE